MLPHFAVKRIGVVHTAYELVLQAFHSPGAVWRSVCSLTRQHGALAGVKNIHAYSWLAHSRKYLEAMASEKAANAAQKVPRQYRARHG